MNQIEKAINDLSSPDKNTRYEACEELRVADSLPESAVAALKTATYDPDPLVADAAKRALAIHRPPPPTEKPPSYSGDVQLQQTPREDTLSTRAFFWGWLWSSAAGFFLGAILGLVPIVLGVYIFGPELEYHPHSWIMFCILFWGASLGFFSSLGPDNFLKLKQIGRVRWRLSSTIGGAIGMSVFGVLSFFVDELQENVILIIGLFSFSLIIGLAQWLALRQAIKSNQRLHLWLVFNCLAYALASAALAGYFVLSENPNYEINDSLLGFASVVISLMIVGAIPAAGMVWILAWKEKAEAANEPDRESHQQPKQSEQEHAL